MVLSGLAAGSAQERVAAQMALADLPLRSFLNDLLVPYESDEVSRLIVDTHDAAAFAPIAHLTDDTSGIAASLLDGLLYGSGDAVIGINPATDNVPQVVKLVTMLDAIIQR